MVNIKIYDWMSQETINLINNIKESELKKENELQKQSELKTKSELKKIKLKLKKQYWENVGNETKKQKLHLLENYDKRLTLDIIKKYGPKIYHSNDYYQLDHKISIDYGFKNNIDFKIIGSIDNLRYILGKENLKKGTKCVF
jgi:hypothetical protein